MNATPTTVHVRGQLYGIRDREKGLLPDRVFTSESVAETIAGALPGRVVVPVEIIESRLLTAVCQAADEVFQGDDDLYREMRALVASRTSP